MAFLQSVTLQGQHVRLEPLNSDHAEGLTHATADGQLWNLWFTGVPSPQTIDVYIATALAQQSADSALPFAVRRVDTGAIVGCTRFCHADAPNRRVEIGYTWYAASAQRSAINTECKRLLLGHAFDTLGCIAVEFRTHWHNQRSRAAIARLGAKQDGVLRNHQRLADGSLRDTVVFSIIQSEWAAVKRSLDFRLAQGSNA